MARHRLRDHRGRSVPSSVVQSAAVALIYLDLRMRNEGLDLELRALRRGTPGRLTTCATRTVAEPSPRRRLRRRARSTSRSTPTRPRRDDWLARTSSRSPSTRRAKPTWFDRLRRRSRTGSPSLLRRGRRSQRGRLAARASSSSSSRSLVVVAFLDLRASRGSTDGAASAARCSARTTARLPATLRRAADRAAGAGDWATRDRRAVPRHRARSSDERTIVDVQPRNDGARLRRQAAARVPASRERASRSPRAPSTACATSDAPGTAEQYARSRRPRERARARTPSPVAATTRARWRRDAGDRIRSASADRRAALVDSRHVGRARRDRRRLIGSVAVHRRPTVVGPARPLALGRQRPAADGRDGASPRSCGSRGST